MWEIPHPFKIQKGEAPKGSGRARQCRAPIDDRSKSRARLTRKTVERRRESAAGRRKWEQLEFGHGEILTVIRHEGAVVFDCGGGDDGVVQ
jgi:hypothetical protein